MPWEYVDGRGNAVRWNLENPSLIELEPGRAYSINCAFIVRDFMPAASSGCICMDSTDTSRDPLPLCFSIHCACGEAVTLQYSTLFLSCGPSAISFRLRSGLPLWVEQADLNVAEL